MLFYTLTIQRSQEFFLQTFCFKDSILLKSHLQKKLSFEGKGMTEQNNFRFIFVYINRTSAK